MNADEMRHKYNLVAIIEAIGAVIAAIGLVLMFMDFPETVGFLDVLVFAVLVIVGVYNIKPSVDKNNALISVLLGVLTLVVVCLTYINLANAIEAQSFFDVGIGIWMMFAGTVIFTIFAISDYLYKRNQ